MGEDKIDLVACRLLNVEMSIKLEVLTAWYRFAVIAVKKPQPQELIFVAGR